MASPAMTNVRNVERGTVLVERLESANSLWAKFMGLMGRPALADDAGLWLPGSNGIHMMFMRFAIDAVFVGKPEADGSREVLSVRRPCHPGAASSGWSGAPTAHSSSRSARSTAARPPSATSCASAEGSRQNGRASCPPEPANITATIS